MKGKRRGRKGKGRKEGGRSREGRKRQEKRIEGRLGWWWWGGGGINAEGKEEHKGVVWRFV